MHTTDKPPTDKPLTTLVPPIATSPFPSRFLVVLGIISCFIATAAFISSFTQIATHFAYFFVPSTIGFLATIIFHVSLYLIWRKHRNSDQSNSVFITSTWIFIGFLLVPLWAVIFYINILFIAGEGPAPGMVLTLVWSKLEWIVLLCLVLKGIYEIEHIKPNGLSLAESLSQDSGASGSDVVTTKPEAPAGSKVPRHIYFVSTVLCTLTLMFSIDNYVHIVWPVNVVVFFLTAPHHLALFITLGRPQYPIPIFSRPTSIWYAIALVVLWGGMLPFGILVSRLEYQSILLGLFGGAETAILAYLVVHRFVSNRGGEGQVRLY